MQTTLRTLKVFLASPSDVKPERVAAEELVNDMNKHLRDIGWQIVLYMWEDVVPGFGRPQERINANVDECAIFVGLLWERWGQQTGKYSSGFEEEFERALARRKATGEPEMWLLFKAVDPLKTKDPGPQLSKVLEFREKQGSVQEVFYNDVADRDEWKSKLSNWFWLYISRHAIAASGTLQPQQPASAPQPESIEDSASHSIDASTDQIKVPQQLLLSATSLTRAIKNRELVPVRDETGALQEFDVARLFLLSASVMYRWYTGDTLQTHEMNLLYKYRERFEFVPIESFQLLRALVADASDVVPGWFWFREMTLENVREQLLVLSDRDSATDVRTRALWLLCKARIPLPEELWLALPLSDDEESVRAGAYKCLATVADESALPLLDELSASEKPAIGFSARDARLSILMRLRPGDAFAEMIKSGAYLSDANLRELQERASAIADSELLSGAESEWGQARKFAVKELTRRGRLPKEVAEKLTEDTLVDIRELAFKALAEQGSAIDLKRVKKALSREKRQANSLGALLGGKTEEEPDADSVILTYYRHQSADSLLATVDWFDPEGTLAYKSLATDHFKAIEGDLRADLENGFERVRRRSIEAIESLLGTEFAGKVVEDFKHLDDFVRSQFVGAALAGLAVNGEPVDIRFGRQHLTSGDTNTKLSAVRIVCRFGSDIDVPALLNVARDSWGDARDEAGICALRLSPNPFEVAVELARSNSSRLIQAGYNWLYAQRSDVVRDFFQTLLNSESEGERLRSVYYVFKTLNTKELEDMLLAYLQRESYYYNVVAWLDRLLYSPLKEFFARRLDEKSTT